MRLIDDGKQRKKNVLPDKLQKNVPTETSCSHTQKKSFDYGFKVLTKSADINNSVPSTLKPMESFSKDPNNNEILYNSSINNNISALLKNFIIDTIGLRLFSNDVKQALLGKGNEAVLRLCLQQLGCSVKKVLTIDVVLNKPFMQSFLKFATVHMLFIEASHDYETLVKGRRQWNTSKLGCSIEMVRNICKDIKSSVDDLTCIQVPNNLQQSQSNILKLKLITEATVKMLNSCTALEDCLKRLRCRISQMRWQDNPLRDTEGFRVSCLNSLNLTWEQAFNNLSLAVDSSFDLVVTKPDIEKLAKAISETNLISMEVAAVGLLNKNVVSLAYLHSLTATLLEWFPVYKIVKGSTIVIVNIHEMVTSSTFIEDVLNLDIDTANPDVPGTGEPINMKHIPKNKPEKIGRTPLNIKYPQIVNLATNFIQLHGFAAQQRRRTEVGNSAGVSLEQIRRHILSKIPELKSVSRYTVHRLMIPPRSSTIASKYYKGLIKAHVAKKQNKEDSNNPDFHFCASQVATANEIFQFHEKETIRISADDKNKINVGTPAVSRYFQIRSFYKSDDDPILPDHDFPYAESKLIPSGYLIMKSKQKESGRCRSLSPVKNLKSSNKRSRSLSLVNNIDNTLNQSENMYTEDRSGRFHIQVPRTGNLHIYTRAQKFHSSSVQSHANDLYDILKTTVVNEKKHAVILTVNNGPDWNVKSMRT